MARPRKTDMRNRILDEASGLFFRHGFYRVPMDELVKKLRTSKSMLYRHFDSKHALVRAVLERVNSRINARLQQVLESEQDFEEKLNDVTHFTAEILSEVGSEFLEDLRTHEPGIWDEYLEWRRDRLDRLYGGLLQQGVEEGVLRDDLDLRVMLQAYTKLTELVIHTEWMRELPVGQQEAYRMISRLFLDGAAK